MLERVMFLTMAGGSISALIDQSQWYEWNSAVGWLVLKQLALLKYILRRIEANHLLSNFSGPRLSLNSDSVIAS